MEKKPFISERNNGFADQFEALNSYQMTNLRGGGGHVEPPLPPPSGEDFPIDIESENMMQIPCLTSLDFLSTIE